jgi:hypothetical protein
MHSDDSVEHFVTLFDSNFLPMGVTLHSSLMSHAQPFHLWIVCMDELVEEQLKRISLPHVTLIPRNAIESQDVLQVKSGRTRAEYCWTLTPFTFQAVFDRDDKIERVTYLDSDLYFFSSPQILLRELDTSERHVLITEHAYDPLYSHATLVNGRFCVQFLTFRKTAQAMTVMRWWQERCLEWCFARSEDGKFGDQKYLDRWPDLFANEVHVVRQIEKTLAPWNVKYFEKLFHGRLDPVFYHFHGLRIVGPNRIRMYTYYSIGAQGMKLYQSYLSALAQSTALLRRHGIMTPVLKESAGITRYILDWILRRQHYATIVL